jgi:hypothetical protein
MHTTGEPILQAQTSMEGEQQHPRRQLHLRQSPTEPRTATWAKDLRSEGRRQHHARAITARVSSRDPARADGSAGRPEASSQLSLEDTSPAHGLGNLTPALVPPVDGPARLQPTKSSFRANSASVHADTAAFGSGSPQKRPRVPLTKQEKPRAARSTEPRDSYASGIRIPHSSPSHEATHTWLSGSVSRQASPSARTEEKTRLHAKNTYMFRPRQP